MPKPHKTIEEHIRARADLARMYAEDGAPWSALRVLRALGDEVELAAKNHDAVIKQLTGAGAMARITPEAQS